MLSIIISSYQKQYYDNLVINIAETIGDNFVYEIIQIWNPNLMGITKAYNIGAKKAKFQNLLFVHEDVVFQTKDWGEKILLHINKKKTGIVGVAGSSYVPIAPSSWTVANRYNYFNLHQGNKLNQEAVLLQNVPFHRNEVFAVDGVFMAVRKTIYAEFKFDEKNLTGFHAYDLDLSLRVSKKYQNYVIDNIMIQHFSEGNLDKIWFDNTIKVRQKIGSSFPQKIDNNVEKEVFIGFINNYFKWHKVNLKTIIFTLRFYPIKRINFNDHFRILKKYYHYLKYASDINKKIIFNKMLK